MELSNIGQALNELKEYKSLFENIEEAKQIKEYYIKNKLKEKTTFNIMKDLYKKFELNRLIGDRKV